MSRSLLRSFSFLATSLLSACAVSSNWYLMDSGYSINPVAGDDEAYAIEVHLNQLKQVGG